MLAQIGPSSEFGTVALSHDGVLAAAAMGDGDSDIYVCRTDASEPPICFRGYRGSHASLCFSASGQRLLSAGNDGTIRYWELPHGRLLSALTGHTAPVVNAVLLPGEEQVLSASLDGSVRLWDLASSSELWSIQSAQEDGLTALAVSCDGKKAAFGGYGPTIEIWDATVRQKLRDLPGHAPRLSCLRFSPDAKWLASGGDDGIVLVHDVATGARVARIAASFAAKAKRDVPSSKPASVKAFRLAPMEGSYADSRVSKPAQ